jgi:PAS domain S-box-containing protein
MPAATTTWGPLLDLLFDDALVGRCLVAPDGRIVRANGAWLRFSGLSREAVVGARFVELFPEARDTHARALAGERVEVPSQARRVQGRERWAAETIAPVPMSGGMGLLVTTRELPRDEETLRRNAEQARAQAAELEAILNSVGDGVVVYDRAGRTIRSTPAADRILGLPLGDRRAPIQDQIGQQFEILSEQGNTVRPEAMAAVRAALHGETTRGEILRIRSGQNEPRWVSTSATPLLLDGKHAGAVISISDVTESRRDGEGLRRYEQLASMTGDIVLFLRRDDGRIIEANAAAVAAYGYAREELLGLTIHDLRAPDTRAETQQQMAIADARGLLFETVHRRKDGSTFAAEVRSVGAGTGGARTLMSVVRDVTERKRGEEALRESQARYQALFEKMINGFALHRLVLDEDGRPVDYVFLEANEAFEKLTGLRKAEILGKGVREVIPGIELEPGDWIGTYGRVALSGEEVRFERYSEQLDRWYAVSAYSPKRDHFVTIFEDITTRKHAEVAVRRSEARFRALADSIPQLAWTAEPDGHVSWFNRRWYEYTGTTSKQVEGWGWQSVHDPATLPDVMRKWKASIATGADFEMEYPLRGADGKFRRFLTRVLPLRDVQGNVLQWFGTSTDVTELVEAQEALREGDRRKTEFLGVLSHELRNPLAPIRNSIYLLERAAPGSEQAARAKEVIQRQTEHLTSLVDDLLDITRISRGKISLRRTRLDLREIVRKTTDDLRSVFAEAGVELRIDFITFGPVWIDADATRMSQILGNLLQNSVKFTPSGGFVAVSVIARGDGAELCVRDDGLGMEPASVQRMFEPFAQADQTLARTNGGLGLGLALVKGLVELHGGTVEARSEGIGRGAEFLVRLPLAEVGSEVGAGDPAAAAQERPRAILVIEDNLDARETLAEILELRGHSVHVARDGRSGLALARELRPDVVLCDIGLPDIDGYEVARELRRDDAFRATQLIALSGYAQPEDRQRARDAGFDSHIAKPADLDELMEVLADGS